MRNISPCVIASMSMFFPSSASIEVLMVDYVALAAPMPRSVYMLCQFYFISGLIILCLIWLIQVMHV